MTSCRVSAARFGPQNMLSFFLCCSQKLAKIPRKDNAHTWKLFVTWNKCHLRSQTDQESCCPRGKGKEIVNRHHWNLGAQYWNCDTNVTHKVDRTTQGPNDSLNLTPGLHWMCSGTGVPCVSSVRRHPSTPTCCDWSAAPPHLPQP